MASGIGDLTAHLSIDTSEFVEPIEEAADKAEESGERIITVIHKQEGSWLAFATNVVPAIGKMIDATSRITELSVKIAMHVIEVHETQAAWAAARASVVNYSVAFLRLAGQLVPPLKAAALSVGLITLNYKLWTSEIVKNAIVNEQQASAMSASYDHMSTAASNLSQSIKTAATEGVGFMSDSLQTGAAFLVQYDLRVIALHHSADYLTAKMEHVAKSFEAMQRNVETLGPVMSTAMFITSSWGQASEEATLAFYEEGVALRQLAIDTEAAIAKQEGQRDGFQGILQAQVAAGEAAAHSAEMAKIASLTTVEAVNAETHALQEKARAAVLAGKPIEQGQLTARFTALANQKSGIESGKITPETIKKSPVDEMIAKAQAQLNALQYSEMDVAIAAARAAGANDEQVASLVRLHDGIASAKDMADAFKEAERLAAEEQKKSDQQREQGIEKIQSMKDQIDLLTGAATAGEIAMREMARQGFAPEQVAEIGALTDELDKLQEKKGKTGKSGPTSSKAVLAGSSEAASIMLRGVTGNNPQLSETKKTNTKLDNLTAAVKANKPVQLKAI